MSGTLTASVRQAAAKATLHLPFHIPAKEWFSIREAAAVLGMSETFVETMFDHSEAEGKGALAGHTHNAESGKRNTKRIPRVFVVAYLVKTATYTDESLCEALIAALRNLPEDSLRRIASAALKRADETRNRR